MRVIHAVCALMPISCVPAGAAIQDAGASVTKPDPARPEAKIRVILTLNLAPGTESPAAISAAQDAFAATAPSGTEIVQRYSDLPMMVILSPPGQLGALRRNPVVAGVDRDGVNTIQAR